MVAALFLAGGISAAAQAQSFPPVISLGSLNGVDGFRLEGVAAEDNSGRPVSAAGDINGDGFDDLIVGAISADPNGTSSAGSSYVVFGRSTPFAATVPLSSLDGSNGFRLDGVAIGHNSGVSASAAGDVNGDGIGDLIVGANSADPNGFQSGSSYVVFGRNTGFAATLALSSLNGSNGFRLDGAAAYNQSGFSVSAAGDVNGDGFDDLIVGTRNAGTSYVVFGRGTPFAATLELSSLDGVEGFSLPGQQSGRSVSGAGDVNGDGIGDLIIGADGASFSANSSGSSYVVFGQTTPFASTLALSSLNGANGFRLDGEAIFQRSGSSVSAAGDVNGDGFDDVIIGAARSNTNGNYSGSSYVVFGKATGFAATQNLSILNGSNGFRLDGTAIRDQAGVSVSAAGDINGDGFDDVIIGAHGAQPNGSYSGSSYVVFGKSSGFAASQNLSSLNGADGFRLDGVAEGDRSGYSVSGAGDINGDGVDEVIVGAFDSDSNGSNSGSSYVVFGIPRPDEIFEDGFE